MKIGVLALQGDFLEHLNALQKCGVNSVEVRNTKDLAKCSALIIPGGESTTISKLLFLSGLDKEIRKMARKGMPIYGTCAGAILISKKIIGEKRFKPLNLIGIDIARNAYGRQINSFESELEIKGFEKPLNAIFIRAPIIRKAGKKVEILARCGKEIVLARQGNILVSTFHPELEGDLRVHKLFISMIK